MGWANRITLGRAVVTGALWALIACAAPSPSATGWTWIFVLFVVAAVTDAVDGIVARRFDGVSVLGRIADPLVDKLLVLGTMTVLLGVPAVQSVLPPWVVAVILAREMVVTAMRASVEARGASFAAAAFGKTKMTLQCVAVGAAILHGAGAAIARAPVPVLSALPGGEERWSLAHVLVWVALVVTVVSGVDSVVRAARLLRRA